MTISLIWHSSCYESFTTVYCNLQASVRLETTSRKTQPHVAHSHWIGSETIEHRSFLRVEEVGISRTLAFSCEHGCSPEEYATMREKQCYWHLVAVDLYMCIWCTVAGIVCWAACQRHWSSVVSAFYQLAHQRCHLPAGRSTVGKQTIQVVSAETKHTQISSSWCNNSRVASDHIWKTGPHIETPNTLRGRGMVRRYPSSQSQVWGSIVAPPMESGAVRPGQKTKTILMHFVP